jgi:hypothetical protein
VDAAALNMDCFIKDATEIRLKDLSAWYSVININMQCRDTPNRQQQQVKKTHGSAN